MQKKTEPKAKRVMKFTDAKDGLTLYISPIQVAALKEVRKQYVDPNSVSAYTGTPSSYDFVHPDTLCIIYTNSGREFQVREHIAIVTAVLKGEDPAPAEVIFGED